MPGLLKPGFRTLGAITLAASIFLSACTGPTVTPTTAPAAKATTAPAAVATTAPAAAATIAPTMAAASPTAAAKPTEAPKVVSSPSAAATTSTSSSPTAAAKPTSMATGTAVSGLSASPTAAAKAPGMATGTAVPAGATPVTVSQVQSAVQANQEYSVVSTMTLGSGETVDQKTFTKGKKIRQEVNALGVSSIIIIDGDTKVAYILSDVPGTTQKTGLKMDLSQADSQFEWPSETVSAIPPNSSPVGIDLIDGKLATIFETKDAENTTRIWIWNERGLPLKTEIAPNSGDPKEKVTITYKDYQFGSQPASLFEVPAGTQIMEMPVVPGLTPTTKP